jgi:photosystem II stability/assembly factor-like uncharacterized protein
MLDRRHPFLALLPFLTALVAQRAHAQSWRHVSLGEQREIAVWQDPNDSGHQRVWVAEDGGRVRFGERLNGSTTWTHQNTPTAVRGPLLDIFMMPNGLRGAACGTDGRIITTINGGTTWTLRPQAMEYNTNDPALLWGIHAFTTGLTLLAGVRTLSFSTDGASTWTRVTIVPGSHYVFGTYYSFDFITNTDGSPRHGIVTVKPAHILYTQNGTHWSQASMFDLTGAAATFPVDYELWDAHFEPNPANPDAAQGYCAGGGNPTRLFRTNDSGRTWHEEPTSGNPTNIPYAVAAWSTQDAIACGYGGMILRRQMTAGGPSWSSIVPSGPAGSCDLSGRFSAPLIGADATPTGMTWVVGSFGFLQHADLSTGASLVQDTPQNWAMWRMTSLAFYNEQSGYVASQIAIGKTSDGGVTWGTAACTQNLTTLSDIALDANGTSGVAVGIAEGSSLGSPGSLNPSAWSLQGGAWQKSTLRGEALNAVAAGQGYFLAAGGNGKIWLTNDGGMSFTHIASPDTATLLGSPNLSDVSVFGPTHAIAVGTEGGIGVCYETTNLVTWNRVPITGSTASLNALAVRIHGTTLRIVAVGATGTVLTGDITGLASFNPVPPSTAHDLRSVAMPAGAPDVFVGGNYGVMFRFDGVTWQDLPSRTSKDIRGLWFRDANYGYAATCSGQATSDTALGSVASSCFIGWR